MTELAQTITLRPETEGDLELSLAIYASTRAEELALVDWPTAQKRDFVQMQFQAQRAHYRTRMPNAEYLIVEVDGDAIGRLYVDRRDAEIRVVDIALLERARGRGIGRHLLNSILDEAKKTGRKVSLHVEHNNPALLWYERIGFRPVADAGVYQLMEWSPPS